MESGFGRLVRTPGNRWQTPQTRPCRLREEASHLRQHRADQTTTMDPQKARRSDLNQWLLSEVEGSLSMIAAVGLTSRPICSRHFT